MGRRTEAPTKTAVSGPVPIFPPYEYRVMENFTYFGIWYYGGAHFFVDTVTCHDLSVPIEEAPKIIKYLQRCMKARKR